MASADIELKTEAKSTPGISVSTYQSSDKVTNNTISVDTRRDEDPNEVHALSHHVEKNEDSDKTFYSDNNFKAEDTIVTVTENSKSDVDISSRIGRHEARISTIASNTVCDQDQNNTNIKESDVDQVSNENVGIENAADVTPCRLKGAKEHCLKLHEPLDTGDDSNHQASGLQSASVKERESTISTEGDDIPREFTTLTSGQVSEIERCQKHPGKRVRYRCKNDSVLFCETCFESEHKACTVELKTDRETKFEGNDELISAKKQLTDLENDIGSSNILISEKVEMVRKYKDKARKDITAFREEINAFLDQIEERVLNEAQSIEGDCVRKLEALCDETARLTTMVNVVRKEIENFESQPGITSLSIINLEKMLKDINKIRTGYRLVNERARVTKFAFKPGKVFEDLFNRANALGELSIIEEHDTVGAKFIEDMCLTLSWRETFYSNTSFTGITLLPSEMLVIAGWSSCTVFLIDVASSAVLSRLDLSSKPWDVTNGSSNRVAITLPDDEAIQLLTVTNNILNVDSQIKAPGKCYGIACTYDAFVVALPGQIAMIDSQGIVLKTFTNGACGAELSTETLRIALDLDRCSVYVCDNQRSTVTRLSLINGEVMGFYMNGSLVKPAGLVVDKYGHVIVCGRNSNSVHCLTPYLTEGWRILGAEDDVIGPRCLAYCPRTHSLYLGREYPIDKKIKVFKLH